MKVALTAAQGILHAAKLALDGAILFIEGVKVAYKVGVSAITALTDFILTEIINIHEIRFRVALSAANGGEFMCQIKGVLLGNELNVEVNFNIRDIASLIKNIAERAVSGLSGFID